MSRMLHLPRLVLAGIAALLTALLAPALDDYQARVRHSRGGPNRLESGDAAHHGVEELAPPVAPQGDILGALPISAPAVAGSAVDGATDSTPASHASQPALLAVSPRIDGFGAGVRVATLPPDWPSPAPSYRPVQARAPPIA
jgi:hypothetical protein